MTTSVFNAKKELFDIVNERDEIIGEATRKEAHSNPNLVHRAIHIWIINDKGEILLQQRSYKMDNEPGMWDTSCGGHFHKGDTVESASKNELREELGIIANCRLISKYIEKSKNQTEMVYLYYSIHNGPFNFSKVEVEKVKFFSEEKALKFIKTSAKASYYSKKEIPLVYKFIATQQGKSA